MLLPQLVYGSSDRGRIRGYTLLGRSSGVDDRAAKAFCRWAPSHGALQGSDGDADSLNFFPVDDARFIVSRTCYGGPEYSGRGGMQVVTVGLLIDREQLQQFEANPLQVVHAATALGHLVLPQTFRTTIPLATLPNTAFHSMFSVSADNAMIEDVMPLLTAGRKLVLVGAADPAHFLDSLFKFPTGYDRLQLSFSTGLRLSASRDFRIQFLSAADHQTIRQLQSRGFDCLRMPAMS